MGSQPTSQDNRSIHLPMEDKQSTHIPSGKLTWQWKMNLLKMYSLLKIVIFHCYVSLPEYIYICPQGGWCLLQTGHPIIFRSKMESMNSSNTHLKFNCSTLQYIFNIYHPKRKRDSSSFAIIFQGLCVKLQGCNLSSQP